MHWPATWKLSNNISLLATLPLASISYDLGIKKSVWGSPPSSPSIVFSLHEKKTRNVKTDIIYIRLDITTPEQ